MGSSAPPYNRCDHSSDLGGSFQNDGQAGSNPKVRVADDLGVDRFGHHQRVSASTIRFDSARYQLFSVVCSKMTLMRGGPHTTDIDKDATWSAGFDPSASAVILLAVFS